MSYIIKVENLGKKYKIRHQQQERYTALRDIIAHKATAPLRWLATQRSAFSSQRSVNTNGNGAYANCADANPQSANANGQIVSDAELGAANGLASDLTLDPLPPTSEEFWALKDVSFEVKQGEVVGIIGRNGAGKSTLLKILSRITQPSEGRVRLRGRVASLLEVGTGFHPELTGRENIFLNGAILGMTRAEVKKKFDEIVAFAEVEKFLETPVKRYSSGMYVRLAFAVAAHLEPEVLLVDEVLAVGDAEFQKKCLGKMSEVAQGGRTVLFVSHNIAAVQSLCGHAIFLDCGHLRGFGNVELIVHNYLTSITSDDRHGNDFEIPLGSALALKRFEFAPPTPNAGDAVSFYIEISRKQPTQIKNLAVLIFSRYGTRVAILDLRKNCVLNVSLSSAPFVLEGQIRSLPLVEGDYRVGLYVETESYQHDFLDLKCFSVATRPSPTGFVPYHPAYRGFLELEFSAQMTGDQGSGIELWNSDVNLASPCDQTKAD
jgi:lipopolysaccharide transport system ATP-binding protein